MRVRLRLKGPADADAVFRLLSDMTVIRYMSFPLFTRADAETFVNELQPAALGPGRYSVDRAIVPQDGDAVIGLCGLVVDRERDDAEAWYLLEPAMWGRGLAAQALRQLLATGFEDYGLHRIWACAAPANAASARVMEKAGMRREGHIRQNLRIHGEWHDSLVYAMLAEEWAGAK